MWPIYPDALAHLSTQQLIDGHAQPFALNVPQRHLDAADRRVQHRTTSPESVAIHPLHQVDDAGRVFTQQHVFVGSHRCGNHKRLVT
jgi:hypothetical protein